MNTYINKALKSKGTIYSGMKEFWRGGREGELDQ